MPEVLGVGATENDNHDMTPKDWLKAEDSEVGEDANDQLLEELSSRELDHYNEELSGLRDEKGGETEASRQWIAQAEATGRYMLGEDGYLTWRREVEGLDAPGS